MLSYFIVFVTGFFAAYVIYGPFRNRQWRLTLSCFRRVKWVISWILSSSMYGIVNLAYLMAWVGKKWLSFAYNADSTEDEGDVAHLGSGDTLFVMIDVGTQTQPPPPPPPPQMAVGPRRPVWVTREGRVWHSTATCQSVICSYGGQRKEPCSRCVLPYVHFIAGDANGGN